MNEEKLKERTQILIDLPEEVSSELEGLGYSAKKQVLDRLSSIAADAKEQLDEENYFGMSTLLMSQGSRVGDPDWLEELITKLESKKQEAGQEDQGLTEE